MSESKIRVAINGFGRIGRCAFKQAVAREELEVVGINDLADVHDLAYLLKYDSVHRWYPRKVEVEEDDLVVGGKRISFTAEKDPAKLPWGDLGADVVLECSGAFRDRDQAAGHLDAGAARVVISAPSDNADVTIVPGVNGDDYDPAEHRVISMASCTTNCLAPVVKVLHERFGIVDAAMTTVHAYTSSQSLVDTPVRKRRRGRAAALSVVPTTTGAAVATTRVIPELEGRIDGMAFRVPVPDGSVVDLVARVERDVTAEEVNAALETAAGEPPLRGILRVTGEALVSSDILGDPHSSIVDAQSTMVVHDRLVKVISWYDNEWGYSARLVDFAGRIGKKG